MALTNLFGPNAKSFASKTAPFAIAAMIGFSGVVAQPASATDIVKPKWTTLKEKPDFTAAEKTPIPTKHCNYLFDRADAAQDDADKKGKTFVSKITKKSLIKFYAFNDKGLPTCTGPREIAWEKGDDYDSIISLANSATGAFKNVIDFRIGYGFRPADRPTTVPGPGADAGAPKVN